MAAATGVTIRIISNRLPQLGPALHAAAVAEVERAGRQIEAAAKAKVPVRTATLQRSIHTVLSNGGLTATVGPSVDYGIYVELGTRNMGARPYMRPAAELVYPQFTARIKALLAKGGG